MGLGPPQGYSANQLHGPIYAPDGSKLFDPADQTKGLLPNAINVKLPPYSAVGDGATDDTAAFASFTTAVGNDGTGYIPAGTYSLTSLPTFATTAQYIFNPGAILLLNGVPQHRLSYYHRQGEPYNVLTETFASGSSTTGTGSIAANSTALSLDSAQDFQTGQGVAVFHAGAAMAVTEPTGLGVTVKGTAGSTAYTIAVAAMDADGGVSTAMQATVTTGPATLDGSNYLAASWTAPSGTAPSGYALWLESGVTWTLIDTTTGTSYDFQGQNNVSTTLGTAYLPSSPPSLALADTLFAQILTGGGTTTLTLDTAATTAATSQPVWHDDTAGWQAAHDAAPSGGAELIGQAGQFNIRTVNITTAGMIVHGAAKSATIFVALNPTGDLFSIGSNWKETFADIGFDSPMRRIGGWGISNASAVPYTKVLRIQLNHMYQGIDMSGVLSILNDVECRDFQYGGVQISAGSDQQVVGLFCDNNAATPPTYGLNLVNTGAVLIARADVIHSGSNLLVNPASGQGVDSLYCSNSYFDTATHGLNVEGGGSCQRWKFVNTWFSNHADSGIKMYNSSLDADFVNCHILNNGTNGVTADFAADWSISHSRIAGNQGSGISLAGGCGTFQIKDNVIGETSGFAGNLEAIFINTGTYTGTEVISGNDMTGNSSGTIEILSGATGTFRIYDNPGYNPVGSLAPSSSPFASGTVYENTYGVDITIYQQAYATTSGAAGSVAVALGSSSTPSTIFTQQISGATTSSTPDIITIRVPTGSYFSFTTSGTTLATANIQGE